MITVTSKESNPISFITGSIVTLICTVNLSRVAQELLQSGDLGEVNIEWTVPNEDTHTGASSRNGMLENTQFTSEYLCNNNMGSITGIIFQCDDTTISYKSIVTVTQFTPGFYNCTTTIATEHPYCASTTLSNGTEFTTG